METLNFVSQDGRNATVEDQISDLAHRAEQANQVASKLHALAKRLATFANAGDISAAIKVSTELRALLAHAELTLRRATEIDVSAIDIAFRKTAYFDAVAEACRAAGLKSARSTEGRLLSYPFAVERSKSGLTLKVGKKTLRQIRPAVVAKFLLSESQNALDFDRVAFLEAAEAAYHLCAAEKKSDHVNVRDLYSAFTLRPGSEKEYPYFEFLVNLNAIDRDGPRVTKSGLTIGFAGASTTRGGRGDVVVTETGREVIYSTVTFRRSV